MNAHRTLAVLVALLVVGGVPGALAASTGGPGATAGDAVHGQDDEPTTDEANATTDEGDGDVADEVDDTTADEGTNATDEDANATVQGVNETGEEENVTNVTFSDQTSNGSAVVVEAVALGETKPPGGFVSIHLAANDSDAGTVTDAAETEIGDAAETEVGEAENATDDGAENVTGDGMENATDAAGSDEVNVTEDELGERIGVSAFLDPGEHENVTVELDRTLSENRTLFAVVHQDTQSDEQFSPEADQPVEADGGIVADAASVNVSETADAETAAGEETTVGEGEEEETVVEVETTTEDEEA